MVLIGNGINGRDLRLGNQSPIDGNWHVALFPHHFRQMQLMGDTPFIGRYLQFSTYRSKSDIILTKQLKCNIIYCHDKMRLQWLVKNENTMYLLN